MKIEIISWGRKHGKTPTGYVAIDCTTLCNPHFEPHLRDLDGRDPKIVDRVKVDRNHQSEAWDDLQAYARSWVGRGATKLAFVCIGGRHRSVAAAEEFAKWAKNNCHEVTVKHTALP